MNLLHDGARSPRPKNRLITDHNLAQQTAFEGANTSSVASWTYYAFSVPFAWKAWITMRQTRITQTSGQMLDETTSIPSE